MTIVTEPGRASVRRDAVVRFAAMEFLILGPLEVSEEGRKLALGGPKQRAVLAHLILRANRVVPADLLIDGLWGEEPPESARTTLQTYVYRLRKVLGDERIEGREGGYVLAAVTGEIDAVRFQALMRQGKAQQANDPGAAAATLADALSLWRADALADVSEESSLRGEAARLEELRLSATEHRIAAEIAMGRHSTMVSELEALTSRYPLRERLWAHLMLALYQGGRQAEALDAFQRARETLQDELGADPSAELQHLHEQILRRDPSLGQETPRPTPRPTVSPSRVDMQPGTEFAGYRIVSTLGRGGMAVVYLAEHDFLQRKVALKVLAPQLAEDERFRERFVRESRLAASLDHPNVVPIYEAGASGGDLFIAMRYVEGTDLRTVLTGAGPLDPVRAVAICQQVAAALDAAHEQGLVHRDVKPGNVLVARTRSSEAGEHVYLSDFGLTKRSTSESGVTGTGQFVGTLDYAAPEQFQGGTADARTDVYSLGCVLFECLTGHPPFRADNDAGLMYAHLQEEPPPVTAGRPELPAEIDSVIARAMAKAPDDRQPSAGALVGEAAGALHVAGPGTPEGAREPGARPRRLIPLLAAAIALVAGISVYYLLRGGQTPGATVAETPTQPARPSPTPAPSFRTVQRALEPDEKRLMGTIPSEVGSECLPLDRPEPIQGELAALVCSTDELQVLYELFPTQADMNAALEGSVNSRQAPNGECATDRLAVNRYTIGGQRAGRVLCYTITRDGDQSHIEWTDENSSIYAHAVRKDLGDLSLYKWWLSSSGPVASRGAANAAEKDPPASLGPGLRDGSYQLSVSKRQASQFRPDLFPQLGSPATLEIHLIDGAYEIAADGTVIENGQTLLEKPNAIAFVPASASCRGRPLLPVSYEWTATADTITWDKTSGNACGGPQPLTGIPWTRAPSEPGAYLVDLATGRTTPVAGNESAIFASPGIALSPDGTMVAYPGTDPEGRHVMYVADVDGTNVRALAQTTAGLEPRGLQFSPDGSRIVYQARDNATVGDIFVVDVTTGETTQVTHLDPVSSDLWGLGPNFSPDGETVFFSLPVGDLFIRRWDLWSVPASGGTPSLVIPNAIGGRISPDGRTIVYFKHEPTELGFLGDMWLADADGTDAHRLGAVRGNPFSAAWSPDGTRIAFVNIERRSAYVVAVATGEVSRVLEDVVLRFGEWVDDHTWIVGLN